MNIPNLITLSRILIISLFPLIYLKNEFFKINNFYLPFVLVIILIVCYSTDIIDGIIARKKNLVTDLGKIMDPMADSITNITVFFTFTQGFIDLPILLVFVFLYREFFISTLRTVCALKGVALAARKSGKVKTFLQAIISILIVLLLVPYFRGYITLKQLHVSALILSSIAAFYSVVTVIDYVYANRKLLKSFLFD